MKPDRHTSRVVLNAGRGKCVHRVNPLWEGLGESRMDRERGLLNLLRSTRSGRAWAGLNLGVSRAASDSDDEGSCALDRRPSWAFISGLHGRDLDTLAHL